MSVLIGGCGHGIGGARRGTVPRARGRETVRPPTRPPLAAGGDRVRAAGVCRVRPSAPPHWVWLLTLAVAAAAVVAGLGALAGALTHGATDDLPSGVPQRTSVVAVAPGETLSDVAARYAAGGELSAVVDRIKRLNGLSGAQVSAGMPLVVPVRN